MRKLSQSWRRSAIAMVAAYAFALQGLLAAVAVTQAVAADPSIAVICHSADIAGDVSKNGKPQHQTGTCVLCSLAGCSASANATLASPFFAPPVLDGGSAKAMAWIKRETALPPPHRTPKHSQAPPQMA